MRLNPCKQGATLAKNEFGYSDLEIFNMPMKRLFYEWCSSAEKHGAIRVQNTDEMEALADLKPHKIQVGDNPVAIPLNKIL